MTPAPRPADAPAGGRRAARRDATRRRIVEAAVDLHTTVGPSRTSISAIAARAGVQRHTVYAHFPDEAELFRDCAGVWQRRNPFPDPDGWARIADPRERVKAALGDVYAFYDRHGADLTRVFEGAEGVPAMAEALAGRRAQLADLARLLARGWGARGRRRARLLAVLTHALALDTWRSLVVEGGLDAAEAAALMAALAEAAAHATPGAVLAPV